VTEPTTAFDLTAYLPRLIETLIFLGGAAALWFKADAGAREAAAARKAADKAKDEIQDNTVLTQAVHTQTNGTNAALREENARLKDEVFKTRSINARLRRALMYVASTPAGRALIEQHEAKQRIAVTDADYAALERRIIEGERQ
jgi:flagellar motility protein MotE (MotC chaperone)